LKGRYRHASLALISFVATAVGCAFLSTARADEAKLDSADLKFIRNATQGGQEEVALGKLAAEKARATT